MTSKKYLRREFPKLIITVIIAGFVLGPNGKYVTPIWKVGGKSDKTKMIRSITPSGFANAFFKANQ